MEEKAIKDLWIDVKKQVEPLFANFKYIEIPPELSSKVANSTSAPTPQAPEERNISLESD